MAVDLLHFWPNSVCFDKCGDSMGLINRTYDHYPFSMEMFCFTNSDDFVLCSFSESNY